MGGAMLTVVCRSRCRASARAFVWWGTGQVEEFVEASTVGLAENMASISKKLQEQQAKVGKVRTVAATGRARPPARLRRNRECECLCLSRLSWVIVVPVPVPAPVPAPRARA